MSSCSPSCGPTRAGELDTWPLALVRHAKAAPRGKWKGDDRERPLDAAAEARPASVAAVLAAYGVTRRRHSSSVRCSDTVQPYAAAAGLRLRPRDGLSEEGYAAHPDRRARDLRRLLEAASRRRCAATVRCCRACSSRSAREPTPRTPA